MNEKKKKDREIVLELEAQSKEVRHQLLEQLRCLDQRLESHHCMTWELMDFYQHRAEIEQEYSKNLERLVKQIKVRHKSEKQKRETWSAYSTYKLWQNLLDVTLATSRNHSVLSEAYGTVSVKGFLQILDDLQHIYCKCKEIAASLHKEVIKVLDELQNSMKTYHLYHGQYRQAELKLQRAETQRVRVAQDARKSGGTVSKRYLSCEKQTAKQKAKWENSNQKLMRARNDYLLSIETANGCMRKYFMEDLPELMDAMDYGYHLSMSKVMTVNVELERAVCNRQLGLLSGVEQDAINLNQHVDRQAFIQTSHQTFSLPKKYKFQPHKGDCMSELVAQRPVLTELNERFKVIMERIQELKLQNEELWKTLETAESSMMEKRMLKDFEVEFLFKEDRSQGRISIDLEKTRVEQVETQSFYLNKFKEFLVNSNMIARLQARSSAIEKSLVNSNVQVTRPMPIIPKAQKKKHLGKAATEGRPKLFGGSIEEYAQMMCQEIPLVIRCCVNIINLHGMHQQGLFRVPGSQQEIVEFKHIFERGEEVVLKTVEARDLNSVAGVLKLYFRELREPLFPLQLFDELISCITSDQNDLDSESIEKSISRIQELLLPLPRATVLVMRYLFAFLNHVTEHSDENRMDARNLAICFGPTLLPMPPERANCQGKVNDLVQLLIVHHEKIFPNDGGLVYEKCMTENCDFEDSVDCTLESVPDLKGEDSDDDLINLEAVALYDFESRTDRELSFKKGDLLLLKRRISEDWWEGIHGKQEGLIPNKFVATTQKSARVGERLRTSSESLPNKSSEVTHNLPPATEGFDRCKSESNICDDLVSSPAAVGQSGSSTTSDLSHGDGSLATWSGKSSSSKEILDEPVLLTDSEAASPVGCGTSLNVKHLSEDTGWNTSVFGENESLLSNVNRSSNVASSTDLIVSACQGAQSEDSTLKKVASLELCSEETFSDNVKSAKRFTMFPQNIEQGQAEVVVGKSLSENATSDSSTDQGYFNTAALNSDSVADQGTLKRDESHFPVDCYDGTENIRNAALDQEHVPVEFCDQTIPLDPLDHDDVFSATMAEFNKAVNSFSDEASSILAALEGPSVAQNFPVNALELPFFTENVPPPPTDPAPSPVPTASSVVALSHAKCSQLPCLVYPLTSCFPEPPGEHKSFSPSLAGEPNPCQSSVMPFFSSLSLPSSSMLPPPGNSLGLSSSSFHESGTNIEEPNPVSSELKEESAVSRKSVSPSPKDACKSIVWHPESACQEEMNELMIQEPPLAQQLHLGSGSEESLDGKFCNDISSGNKLKAKPPPVMKKPPKSKSNQ